MTLLRLVGSHALLLHRTVRAVRREGLSFRAVLVELRELGTSSAALIAVGMSFFGAVLIAIAWAQARRYTGNIAILGPPYFELIFRELGPMLSALLFATRAAAAMSAELGSMAVNEQLEALELSAADPLSELVAPRVVASALAMPLLAAIGTVAAAASAALTASFALGADGFAFINPQLVDSGDVACTALKSLLNGAFVPLAAAVRGLAARGGAGAVGEAVTLGVVEACMGCLLIDFVVTVAFRLVGI